MLWAWGGAENRAEQPEVSGGPGWEGKAAPSFQKVQNASCVLLFCLSDWVYFVWPQYSQKEDKYEEEIKVLTDKLKEVS